MYMVFDTDVAAEIGLNHAILLSNIAYWVHRNEANNMNFHDGCYWTYNTADGFIRLFPFWTRSIIYKALGWLERNGYIKSGNYNADKMNRTKWYTLTEKSRRIGDKSSYPTGQCELSPTTNGVIRGQVSSYIQNKHTKETQTKHSEPPNFPNGSPQLLEAWNGFRDMRKSMRKPLTERATALTLKKLDELSGGDEKKKIAILNQSVMNGWQSVYALHADKRKNSNTDDIYNDALAMLEQEGVFDDDGQGGNDCNH